MESQKYLYLCLAFYADKYKKVHKHWGAFFSPGFFATKTEDQQSSLRHRFDIQFKFIQLEFIVLKWGIMY